MSPERPLFHPQAIITRISLANIAGAGYIDAQMQIVLEPKVRAILSRLQSFLAQKGGRGYIVGGFLRDLVLGRPIRDLDIAIDDDAVALGHTLAHELTAKTVLLDDAHGVVRLILLEPEDGEWQIDLSTIHSNLASDLKRRDFTLDALACDIALPAWDSVDALTIEIIDPLGGLTDIKNRLVRATHDEVFRHDAIRLLRAARLAAELGFKIDSTTEALIRRDALLIQHEAGERVREEFLRILKLKGTDETLLYIQKMGLLTAIIPELAPSVGLEQRSEHQWDVFQHSIHSVTALDFLLRHDDWPYTSKDVLRDVPWDNSLADYFQTPLSPISTRRELGKLAAILHDVAKPQTKVVSPSGKLCFYGHPQEGAITVEKILDRLRFSTREKKLVAAVVRHHLRPVQTCKEGELPAKRAVYRLMRDLGEMTIDTLFFSLADHLATRGEKLDLTNWRHHANIVSCVLAENARAAKAAPIKLLNGHDLQQALGLKPGAKLGEIIAELREAQATGEIVNKDEALQYAKRLLSERV